jgi:uncharacterized membrane protein
VRIKFPHFATLNAGYEAVAQRRFDIGCGGACALSFPSCRRRASRSTSPRRGAQEAGINITAPVVQLQIVVTLALAVAVLGEPCSLLQGIGGAVMVTGALVARLQRPDARRAGAPVFVAPYLRGYLSASLAALAYGATPIMTRFALEHTGPTSGILGGLIAYGAATAVVAIALLWPRLWREVSAVERENIRWFVYSGVFVAFAQGLFYSVVAVAPVMLVAPLLQFSLVFRLLFSKWLNPHHEVFGALVAVGVAASILDAIAVSVDTDLVLHALAVPDSLARVLRWRI